MDGVVVAAGGAGDAEFAGGVDECIGQTPTSASGVTGVADRPNCGITRANARWLGISWGGHDDVLPAMLKPIKAAGFQAF